MRASVSQSSTSSTSHSLPSVHIRLKEKLHQSFLHTQQPLKNVPSVQVVASVRPTSVVAEGYRRLLPSAKGTPLPPSVHVRSAQLDPSLATAPCATLGAQGD
ncbi:Collagen alpha [Sesbania bispinosa]|nr:Collagen alpha [Sesbania bispinosa]